MLSVSFFSRWVPNMNTVSGGIQALQFKGSKKFSLI